MNVIELSRVDPLVFQIVDFEFDIRWDERRLDGADVVSEDFRRWVLERVSKFYTRARGLYLVAHIDGPYSRAGSNVEYPLWILANWSQMQLAVQAQSLDVMIEV